MGSHLQWSLEARTHMRTSVESYGTNILKTRILRKIINAKSCKPQEKRHREDIKATRTRTNPGKTEGRRVINEKENRCAQKRASQDPARMPCGTHVCGQLVSAPPWRSRRRRVVHPLLLERESAARKVCSACRERDEDVRLALPGPSLEHAFRKQTKTLSI